MSLLNTPNSALGRVCKVQLSSKSKGHNSSLNAIWSWHDKNKFVTLDRCDECQPNASIATGGLNEDSLMDIKYVNSDFP